MHVYKLLRKYICFYVYAYVCMSMCPMYIGTLVAAVSASLPPWGQCVSFKLTAIAKSLAAAVKNLAESH